MATTELDDARAAAAAATKKVHLMELAENPHAFYLEGYSGGVDMRLLHVARTQEQIKFFTNRWTPMVGKAILGATTISIVVPFMCDVTTAEYKNHETGGIAMSMSEMKKATITKLRYLWTSSKVFIPPVLVKCVPKDTLAECVADVTIKTLQSGWQQIVDSDSLKADLALLAMQNGDADTDTLKFTYKDAVFGIMFTHVIDSAVTGIRPEDYKAVGQVVVDKADAIIKPTFILNSGIMSKNAAGVTEITADNIKATVLAELK